MGLSSSVGPTRELLQENHSNVFWPSDQNNTKMIIIHYQTNFETINPRKISTLLDSLTDLHHTFDSYLEIHRYLIGVRTCTLDFGIDVGQEINIGTGKFGKNLMSLYWKTRNRNVFRFLKINLIDVRRSS